MRKIFLFIVTLICMCSCYKTIIVEDGGLKWGYYGDVYIPNDSLVYYMNCIVAKDRAEFQCSEKKRIEIKIDTLHTNFGDYVHKRDSVTIKTMSTVLFAREFKEMLRAVHDEKGGGPTIDIGNGVFITRKLFNEVYDNYILN